MGISAMFAAYKKLASLNVKPFQENELILMSVLNCVYDSISQILRKNVEKKAVFENLVSVNLLMDSITEPML